MIAELGDLERREVPEGLEVFWATETPRPPRRPRVSWLEARENYSIACGLTRLLQRAFLIGAGTLYTTRPSPEVVCFRFRRRGEDRGQANRCMWEVPSCALRPLLGTIAMSLMGEAHLCGGRAAIRLVHGVRSRDCVIETCNDDYRGERWLVFELGEARWEPFRP